MLFENQKLADRAALSASLNAAIDAAAEVFGGRRVSVPLGVCHCNVCCSEENERLLAETALHELSSALLSEYTNSAHGYAEAADGEVLRYFLPRYFELIALNDPPHYGDLWHCLARLGKADYRHAWQAEERDAIDSYFDALLTDKLADISLETWPGGAALAYPVGDLVEMMVIGGGDLERLLATFEAAADPGVPLHAAVLARNLARQGGGCEYASEILEDHAEARRSIARFLLSPELATRMESAASMLDEQSELQEILAAGRQLLAGFRAGD